MARLRRTIACWAAVLCSTSVYQQASAFMPLGHLSGLAGRQPTALRATSDLYSQVEGMKVTELKEHLRRLNKPVSGTKQVLQDRLKEALGEESVPLTPVVPKAVIVPDEEDDDDYEMNLNSGRFDRPRGDRPRGDRPPRRREEFTPASEDDLELGQEINGEVRGITNNNHWMCWRGWKVPLRQMPAGHWPSSLG